jgi:ApbE family
VVAIGHPLRESPAATIGLCSGAVATSSRVRRAWGQGDDRRHHLIDPATGAPARSGLAAVTVVAAAGWQAEVVAKAAFVAGIVEGLHYAGFGLFVVTTVHGLSAGTDRRSPAFLLAVAVACGMVVLLTAVRLRKVPVASGRRVVQAEAVGGGGRLGAAVDAQLGEDVADVDAGRLAADEQRLGDLAVGAARRHQA